MNTGKIELITNKSLKNALLEWSRELKQNKSTYVIFEKWIEDGILPYLTKNIALKNIDIYGSIAWKAKSKFESGIETILNDREFENIIDNNLYHLSKIKLEKPFPFQLSIHRWESQMTSSIQASYISSETMNYEFSFRLGVAIFLRFQKLNRYGLIIQLINIFLF